MHLKFLILLLAFCVSGTQRCHANAFYQSGQNSIILEQFGQNPNIKPIQKKGEIKKHKNKRDKKSFPLFATLGTVSGIFALVLLGLGIYLGFPLFIGILTGLLSAAAITLGVYGLKKEENRSFCFVSIMLGAVGILGALFFMISAL